MKSATTSELTPARNRQYAFFNVKAMVTNVAMLDKSHHAIQDSASSLQCFELIFVFPPDNRSCMYAMIREAAICKILIQFGYRSGNVHGLIMEYHGNNVIRRAKIIRSEISAFINEDAQFAHRKILPDIRIAGNIPALDGPGSFDQPQSVS